MKKSSDTDVLMVVLDIEGYPLRSLWAALIVVSLITSKCLIADVVRRTWINHGSMCSQQIIYQDRLKDALAEPCCNLTFG